MVSWLTNVLIVVKEMVVLLFLLLLLSHESEKKNTFLFIINLFNSIVLPFSSNPDDLNLYFPTIELLKMCTHHFVVDFSIFFWFPFFLSNLLLHPNHTVCKANVPEMITEDYISDVEEGIFIFLHFFICSFASFMLLSVCP